MYADRPNQGQNQATVLESGSTTTRKQPQISRRIAILSRFWPVLAVFTLFGSPFGLEGAPVGQPAHDAATYLYRSTYAVGVPQMQAWSIVVDGKRSIFLTPLERSAMETFLFLDHRFGKGRVSSVKPVGEKNCQTKKTPFKGFIPL